MSTRMMAEVWPLQMPPTAKAVFVSLADNANDHGDCWPSIATIGERTCFSKRAVIGAIAWLEEHGALVADRANGRHTKYVLTPRDYVQPAGADRAPLPVQEAHQCMSGTGAGNAPTGAGNAPSPVHLPHQPVQQLHTNRQEPSFEPSMNRQVGPADAEPAQGGLQFHAEPVAKKPTKQESKTTAVWQAYAAAYANVYRAPPVRNRQVNAQLSAFIDRVGAQEGPSIAAFFLTHPSAYYRTRGHSVGCLLSDAEKLRTEWATQRVTTATQARQQERTASNPAARIAAELRAREGAHAT